MIRTPDWEHWRQILETELWKCIALSCVVEPFGTTFDDLLKHLHYSERGGDKEVWEQVRKRIEIAESHIDANQFPAVRDINWRNLPYSRVSLPEFAAWASEPVIGWRMPPELIALADHAELKSAAWEGFDQDADDYPPELDIAMQAWRAVTNKRDGSKTPREQILGWVKKHYPDLSEEGKERIAVICNWERKGGRPRRQQDN